MTEPKTEQYYEIKNYLIEEELDELRAFVYYVLDDNSLDDIEFLASRLLDKWQNNWSCEDLPVFSVDQVVRLDSSEYQ